MGGQKGFLMNYVEVQNSGMVCGDWILRQEREIFTVLISISNSMEESMNNVGLRWTFESKLTLGKMKARRFFEGGGLG